MDGPPPVCLHLLRGPESSMSRLSTELEDTSSSTALSITMRLEGCWQPGKKLQDTNSSTRIHEPCRPHRRGGYTHTSKLVCTVVFADTTSCCDIAELILGGQAVIQVTTEPYDHTLWDWNVPRDGCNENGVASIGCHDIILHGHTNISDKQKLGREADRGWHEDRFILLGEPDSKPCHSGATYNGSIVCLSVWGVASAALLAP